MTEPKTFIVDESYVGKRLDSMLADMFPDYSRSSWQKLIADGKILVDGAVKPAKYSLHAGELVAFHGLENNEPTISLPILYEDEDVLVINKPPGLLVHARNELNAEPTVVDFVVDALADTEGERPGIVHRLDRDTSGVMIIAKNDKTKSYLMKQFQNRTVKKEYMAVVEGVVNDKKAVFKWPISRNQSKPSTFKVDPLGKQAITRMEVVARTEDETCVRLLPETGRTHQLRVHMKHYGHPIVGDRVYSGSTGRQGRLLLHAQRLSVAIRHDGYRTFEAPLPGDFPCA